MKSHQGLVVAAGLMMVAQISGGADITGKVVFKGAPPASPKIPFDPQCGKFHKTDRNMPFYVTGAGGELADVFVYLKSGVTAKPAATGPSPLLDQVGCEYTPYVLGLQTKQKLLIRNSDPGILHNVHPMPAPDTGNKEANKAQPAGTKDLEFTFDNPEVFLRFKCDVHPWMFAYVGVLDHPYFAVSGKDGTFKIANVPPGKYVVEAVHRKTHPTGKGLTQEITVGADGAKADFAIEAPK